MYTSLKNGIAAFVSWTFLANILCSIPALAQNQRGAAVQAAALQRFQQFYGVGDPRFDSAAQIARRHKLCDELRDVVLDAARAGKIDAGDPTAGLGGSVQHAFASTIGMGSDLFTLLRDRGAPNDLALQGNFYASVTTGYEDQLKRLVLNSTYQWTPGDLLNSALAITNNNYTLATLTCHNLLKNVAYYGREDTEWSGKTLTIKVDDHRFAVPFATKLVNLRGNTKYGEKLGPWYHIFGVLFLGSITSRVQSTSMTAAEQFSRYLISLKGGNKDYSPVDKEKADWDHCAVGLVKVFNPILYGGEKPPTVAVDEPKQEERKIIVDASAIPTAAQSGTNFSLKLTYRLTGLQPDEKITVRRTVTITGEQTIVLPQKSDDVTAAKPTITATPEARFAKIGRYKWFYQIEAPYYETATGTVNFEVQPQRAAASLTGTWISHSSLSQGAQAGAGKDVLIKIVQNGNSAQILGTEHFGGTFDGTIFSGTWNSTTPHNGAPMPIGGTFSFKVDPTLNHMGGIVRMEWMRVTTNRTVVVDFNFSADRKK